MERKIRSDLNDVFFKGNEMRNRIVFPFWRRAGKPGRICAAIDIGTGEIKLAEILAHGRTALIRSLKKAPVPEGGIHASNLSPAVKNLVDTAGLETNEVITCIGGDEAVTRNIYLPRMPVQELDRAVKWEAGKYLSPQAGDFIIRYVVLEEITFLDRRKQFNILLAAAPKEIVYRYIEIFSRAGLEVSAVEIPCLALWRVFRKRAAKGTIAVVNIGESISNFIIMGNKYIRDHRALAFGSSLLYPGDSFPSGAENLTGGGSAKTVNSDDCKSPAESSGRSPAINSFCLEMKKLLDSYRLQDHGDKVEKMVITGGGKDHGLWENLSAKLEIPVEIGAPELPVAENYETSEPVDPVFSVAVGLALRGVPVNA